MSNIKVAIVEDDPQVRSSLQMLINGSPGFTCIGCYPNAESAIAKIPGNPPDVILMDIRLPKASGIECVRAIRAKCSSPNILMLTVDGDAETIFAALQAGANGYVLKGTPPSELLESIADAHAGGSPMSSAVARKVIQFFHGQAAAPGEELSKRETQILELLAQGLTDKEIAAQLHVTFDTVHTHLRRVYSKLHVNSRTQALAQYYKRRWFQWPFGKKPPGVSPSVSNE